MKPKMVMVQEPADEQADDVPMKPAKKPKRKVPRRDGLAKYAKTVAARFK